MVREALRGNWGSRCRSGSCCRRNRSVVAHIPSTIPARYVRYVEARSAVEGRLLSGADAREVRRSDRDIQQLEEPEGQAAERSTGTAVAREMAESPSS